MTRTRGELPSIWSLTVQAHGLALRFARLNTVALLCHAGAYLALLFLIGSGLLPHGLESLVLEPPGLAELAAAGVAFGGLTFGGSSVAENVAYINGLNVTDPYRRQGFSSVPFAFYKCRSRPAAIRPNSAAAPVA